MKKAYSVCILAVIAALLAGQQCVIRAESEAVDPEPRQYNALATTNIPLNKLKRSIASFAHQFPDLFDPEDLERFNNDQGATSALRILAHRGGKHRRAFRLARRALKWRKQMDLANTDASMFPCDLFKMGLIFEHGRAHDVQPDGRTVETSPVIWIRLGAIGEIIKQLERTRPIEAVSSVYQMARSVLPNRNSRVRNVRGMLSRRRKSFRQMRRRPIGSTSIKYNDTIRHIMRAISWWLDNWIQQNPNSKAILVLDFENTDLAFLSRSFGEFLVNLDDMFPSLFDYIVGFRYGAKLNRVESAISILHRIFKSRVSSSPETDRKLKFVRSDRELGMYIPRVDENGYSLLPEHTSGFCAAPDASRAPANCAQSTDDGSGLYDPSLWEAVYREFYQICKPKSQ